MTNDTIRRGTAQNPYTQADIDAVKPDKNGVRRMPTGHYAARCGFGEGCIFSTRCSFGEGCIFGAWCIFGTWCSFGTRCSFGEGCIFGAWCSFGEGCIFGAWCSFGAWCIFGTWCSFGEGCRFGEGCSFEGRTPDDYKRPFFAVDRIGSENRKAYFFRFGGVMHVRAGCFFGDETAFRAKLDADGDARKSRHYLAALALATDVLGDE